MSARAGVRVSVIPAPIPRRGGGCGCGGEAAAVRPAGPVRCRLRQVGADTGQVRRECRQFRNSVVGVGDPIGDQRKHPLTHRGTDSLLPDLEQIPDLLQRQAEVLGRGDERQPFHRLVAVDPVTRCGPLGGQQAGGLVERNVVAGTSEISASCEIR